MKFKKKIAILNWHFADFISHTQKYPERAIFKVIHFMIRRGELQHRMQRKMLYRIK